MTSPLLSIQNLEVRFISGTPVSGVQLPGSSQAFVAVKRVSFDIPPNAVVALVGESGSGKSVTAMAVTGLLPERNCQVAPDSQILFEGQDLLREPAASRRARAGREISMIFQNPMTSLNPVVPVGEQILEVLRLHPQPGALPARQRVLDLLADVGIPDPASRVHSYPHQLSGGQQQRVMIAMAIACSPRLLIADEPTTALDVTIQQQIIELLLRLRRTTGMSMLFITHDLALVREMADQVVVMRHGEVLEQGPVDAVFAAPRHPYTRALLACRPPLHTRPLRLPVVEDFLDGHTPPPQADRPCRNSSDAGLVLEVRNLKQSFRIKTGLWQHKTLQAVNGVSFQLGRGRTLGIVGESGSGKTTLGRALLRLGRGAEGEVLHDGQNLLALSEADFRPYKRTLQIVFQNPQASLNPRFTVGDSLLEPMRIHGLHGNDAERRAVAADWLKRVGLDGTALRKYPHEFSGGQQQRICIARCLTLQPKVLVCDESVSALDVSVQAQVLNLLQELQDEFAISYLFISHDLSVVRYLADEVLVMQQGAVVEYARADQLYDSPAHPYTRKLLAAIPGTGIRVA